MCHAPFTNYLVIMDLIIENDGLDLIGIKIFGYLSPEDTFKCCFVSKSWQVFIIANKKRLGGAVLEGLLNVCFNVLVPTIFIVYLIRNLTFWILA